MGYTEKELENLRKAALLHDIGKIGIPDNVLNKPGRLDDDEFKIMMATGDNANEGEVLD